MQLGSGQSDLQRNMANNQENYLGRERLKFVRIREERDMFLLSHFSRQTVERAGFSSLLPVPQLCVLK